MNWEARKKVPSDVFGAAALASKPAPKWPMNMGWFLYFCIIKHGYKICPMFTANPFATRTWKELEKWLKNRKMKDK
jgi:hypothetical protein